MKYLLVLFFGLLVTSCATTARLEKLEPGMELAKVKEQMGSPDSTQFMNGAYVLKYTLLKPFHGQQPWYLVFNPNTKRLHSWYMNESEFRRNQAAWGAAFNSINNNLENQSQRDHERQLQYQESLRSIGSQKEVKCVENGKDLYGNQQFKCTK